MSTINARAWGSFQAGLHLFFQELERGTLENIVFCAIIYLNIDRIIYEINRLNIYKIIYEINRTNWLNN